MAVKWIDGAEMWADAGYFSRAYADSASATSNTPGRVSPGTRYINLNGGRIQTPSLGTQNTWVIGFGFFATSTGANQVRLFSGGTEQCRLEIANSGGLPQWKLIRGSTTIATGATFALNQWAYFELKITVRTGTNGVYELRMNETAYFSGSAVNLANLGSDGADSIGFGYGTGVIRLDDIYVLDTTGSTNTDFLGDQVCVAILPTAEGHQNDWTPSTGTNNALLVDDPATASSSTDFNSSDTNTQEDYYVFADLPGSGLGTINAIKVSGSFAMATAGSRTVHYRYYNGSVEATIGSDVVSASTSIVELPQVIEVNPNTSVKWTASEINAAEFGVEVVS